MTRSKLLFFRQEKRYSCAPACLRMVLNALGMDIDEARLRQLADCTPFGTDAFQLVEAARELGFTSTRKYTLSSMDELRRLAAEGKLPIVYVDLWPLSGGASGQYHSLVVLRVEDESVHVLDPLIGEREMSREDFRTAWEEMHSLTIVVSS